MWHGKPLRQDAARRGGLGCVGRFRERGPPQFWSSSILGATGSKAQDQRHQDQVLFEASRLRECWSLQHLRLALLRFLHNRMDFDCQLWSFVGPMPDQRFSMTFVQLLGLNN